MSRVRENRMHGSKGRGWKRALATARGSEHRRETGGISATAYGSYRASPLPDRDRRTGGSARIAWSHTIG